VDFDAGAREGATGKVRLFGLFEVDNTVDGGVDSIILRDESAGAGDFGAAGLTDENFASLDGLTAKTFDAKTLAGVVVNVFAGSASFDV